MRRKEHDKTFKIIEKKFNAKKSWRLSEWTKERKTLWFLAQEQVSRQFHRLSQAPKKHVILASIAYQSFARSYIRRFEFNTTTIIINRNVQEKWQKGRQKKKLVKKEEEKKNTHTFAWKRIIVV